MARIALKTHKISSKSLTSRCLKTYKSIKKDRNVLIGSYKTMKKIQVLEQTCEELYSENLIRGFCHLCYGQEHLYSAIKNILDDDYVMTSYRCHGIAQITGNTDKEIIAEMMGKKSGCSKGKGGSMHLYNDNFFGGHGIVGSQVPLATGLAFSNRYKNINNIEKNKRTVICLFGDGAANQGQVYESFKLAKLYKLNIIYICENNSMGMWTKESEINRGDPIYKRPSFPSVRMKTKNPVKIFSVLKNLKELARKKGPVMLELITKRESKHSQRDENNQVDVGNSVIEEFKNLTIREMNKEKNLIEEFKKLSIEKIDLEIKSDMKKTVEEVKEEKEINSSEIHKDIYLPH